MPSTSYRRWRTIRRAVLDLVETSHTAVHGTGAGRREATRHINHGYAVLLAAEFQGYCRELHTEIVTLLTATVPPALQRIVATGLTFNRQLDRGNASPASLGSDFKRLGLEWWQAVDRVEPSGPVLRKKLDELIEWRNAIAHNDFDPSHPGATMRLKVAMVRDWRRACNDLARVFDQVLADHLESLTGRRPW